MKLKFCLLLGVLIFFQNCCLKKGEEINRETFSVEEKAKIPYADGQTINMVTNEGFQFQLNASTRSFFYSDQEHCEDYISYENYIGNLVSNLPSLNIDLNLSRSYNPIDDIEFIDMGIEINRLYFNYDIEEPLQAIEINGITYTNVYSYTSGIIDNPISEVLFNEANGILKINYLNGDYVQINE